MSQIRKSIKIYLLSREGREKIYEFINEQLKDILDSPNYFK